MKHPLTSKERRGLAAIAAAALLLISVGFGARSCRRPEPSSAKPSSAIAADTAGRDSLRADKNRKNSKRLKKRKARKQPEVYPERDPLSEPCSMQ